MPEVKDHYKTLGVAETASAEEVKKAYRRLAHKHHPDRNAGDKKSEERFKEIQEAYDTLHDPEKRKQYDLMRRHPFGGFGNGFGGAGGGFRPGEGSTYSFETGGDPFGGLGDLFGRAGGGGQEAFGDVFGRIFGAQGNPGAGPAAGGRARAKARDEQTVLRLSFDQALRGGKTEVKLPDGKVIRIDVPKGVQSGFKIRLKGQATPDARGRRGDLYVTFEVEPSPAFRREGNALFTSVTINAFEAMLGTTRSITNAYGKVVKLPVHPGTQPGEKYRLKGQGVETESETGDLYVEVQVSVPKNLPAGAEEKLRKAAAEAGLL